MHSTRSSKFVRLSGVVGGAMLAALVTVLYAADAPKLADLVTAADVAAATESLVKDLDGTLANGLSTKLAREELQRKAYAVALLANGIGGAGGDAKWKSNAAAVRDTAIKLAKLANSKEPGADAAYKLLQEIRSAMAKEGSGDAAAPMDWNDVAPVKDLMKEVNERNKAMRRNARGSAFQRNKEIVARDAVIWVVLGYADRFNTSPAKEAKKPQADYEKHADAFIAGAAELSSAARKGDASASTASLKRAQKACTACHTVYKPDQVDVDN